MSEATANAELEVDLARLDAGIRRLKIQYDMFLGGGLKREPHELRSELEQIIRKHSNKPIGKYAQRFRFNALVSRFNSFSELWGKRVREREEGDVRQAGDSVRAGLRERLVARCRVADAAGSEQDLRRMHSRYIDAQRRSGTAEHRLPSYDAFARTVGSQASRLRKETGCGAIELRLVEKDDTVQIKARPGR